KPLRLPHSVCDFVIIEGYDGVQLDRPAAQPAAAPRKGYWIAHVDVTEPEGYKAYMVADMAAFGKYGGRPPRWRAARRVVGGNVRGRNVVLEFPSYRVALDCYRSPEYQAAAALRKGRAEFDLFIIEGCDAQS